MKYKIVDSDERTDYQHDDSIVEFLGENREHYFLTIDILEKIAGNMNVTEFEVSDEQIKFSTENGHIWITNTLPLTNSDVWSDEDDSVYAPLRKKKLRIEAKARRDKNRVRKFSHKNRKQ